MKQVPLKIKKKKKKKKKKTMHIFDNLNIVLTRTPARTDADTNNWMTTQALQGHSPSELVMIIIID